MAAGRVDAASAAGAGVHGRGSGLVVLEDGTNMTTEIKSFMK